MKHLALIGLSFVSIFSYASHTLNNDDLICTYKDLSALISLSKKAECESFTFETVHLFVPERQGYIAGNGSVYTLKSGEQVSLDNEAFLPADENGDMIEGATWIQSPTLMNGQNYQELQRGDATCYVSSTEELCVQAFKTPNWLPTWFPLWLKEWFVK